MQLVRYTVIQSEVVPSPMNDARWLLISVDRSKMHVLAQIMCQSKGQSSAAILRPETLIVYMFFQVTL